MRRKHLKIAVREISESYLCVDIPEIENEEDSDVDKVND